MASTDAALPIRAALSRYFSALDSRDWPTCLDSFCPLFDADYTSMVGGQPFKDLPRESNLQAWQGMMAGFLKTKHVVVPTSIDLDQDAGRANVGASVTATHELPGGRVWTTVGTYSQTWVKCEEDSVWRIRAVTFRQDRSDPENPMEFIEEATRRVEEAARIDIA